MADDVVKVYFRKWAEGDASGEKRCPCPWYVIEQYEKENGIRLDKVGKKASAGEKKQPVDETCKEGSEHDEEERVQEEWEVELSETQASSSQESAQERNPDTHVLKLLYQGNLAELDRRAEQERKSVLVNKKHDFYRATRCTCTGQEESSAMPAGVMNTYEDSDDEDAYGGEQKEIQREWQELRGYEHWINQHGWDPVGEGMAETSKGERISLRFRGGKSGGSPMEREGGGGVEGKTR